MDKIPEDLMIALKILVAESIEDFTYHVRENEGEGWSGPRVKAYGEACSLVKRYVEGA